MNYSEVKRDLFTLPSDYMLVHCISSDFAMGAGIAKVFRDKYGIRDSIIDIRKPWKGRGRCIFAQSPQCPWSVANLVTKEKYFGKPTYKTLEESLKALKKGLTVHPEIKRIGMPLIGCGLDKLEWDRVYELIVSTFKGMDIEITVCKL